jgi:uncharacterized membrane protein
VVALLLASRVYPYLGGKTARLYQVAITGVVALTILGITQTSQLFPLLLPAIINFSLLGVFGASLFSRHNMIERIARSMKGDLPAEGIAHCRLSQQVRYIVFQGKESSGM